MKVILSLLSDTISDDSSSNNSQNQIIEGFAYISIGVVTVQREDK